MQDEFFPEWEGALI